MPMRLFKNVQLLHLPQGEARDILVGGSKILSIQEQMEVGSLPVQILDMSELPSPLLDLLTNVFTRLVAAGRLVSLPRA